MRAVREASKRRFSGLILALLVCATLGACRAPRPFPRVDLSAPDWKTRSGQAIWRPDRDKPEIVGDLLVSVHPDAGAYLQFSKALPIVSARLHKEAWEIEFPPQNKKYAAPGRPPKRIVWFQLLRVTRGEPATDNWQVREPSPDEIVFENPKSGERLEVHF